MPKPQYVQVHLSHCQRFASTSGLERNLFQEFPNDFSNKTGVLKPPRHQFRGANGQACHPHQGILA